MLHEAERALWMAVIRIAKGMPATESLHEFSKSYRDIAQSLDEIDNASTWFSQFSRIESSPPALLSSTQHLLPPRNVEAPMSPIPPHDTSLNTPSTTPSFDEPPSHDPANAHDHRSASFSPEETPCKTIPGQTSVDMHDLHIASPQLNRPILNCTGESSVRPGLLNCSATSVMNEDLGSPS